MIDLGFMVVINPRDDFIKNFLTPVEKSFLGYASTYVDDLSGCERSQISHDELHV